MRHSDVFCRDPQAGLLAQALLSESERAALEESPRRKVESTIALTHGCFNDRMVLDMASVHQRQVVLIGSGMDTRAYRLDIAPSFKFIEVDLPLVHTLKEEALTGAGQRSRCSVTRLAAPESFDVDASLPDTLKESLNPKRPTLFLIEGLALRAELHSKLFEELAAFAKNGSRLVIQLRASSFPEDVELPSLAASAVSSLSASGWERANVVSQTNLSKALRGVEAPPDEEALILVAEKGRNAPPGAPAAPLRSAAREVTL